MNWMRSILTACLLAAPAFPQIASLRGQVTDESGAVVPGAVVVAVGPHQLRQAFASDVVARHARIDEALRELAEPRHLGVRARPLSGEIDQGFGFVWRYKDVNNYYVTRCNADEDNCTIYHTVKGRRRAFLNQSVKVAKNTWHTMKLEVTGDHFIVWYDGNKVLDAKDASFKEAGRVGLWTKADSVIEFDDLVVEGH